MSYSVANADGIYTVRDEHGQAMCVASSDASAEAICEALRINDALVSEFSEIFHDDASAIERIDPVALALCIQEAIEFGEDFNRPIGT